MSRFAEDILRRNRTVTIAGLALLALLAWLWLLAGAGMGMAARGEFLVFPHRSHGMEMILPWDAWRVAINLAMWWVMMVAMMIPAAAPVVLLYARAAPASGTAPRTGAFLAGYLIVWLVFSALAVALQIALETHGLLSPMGMALTSRWFTGGALLAAGTYQLTPAKDACLTHCRNPADFLSRHFRGGRAGALRMGLIHGAYCVGCCWMLMALLFVVGVMNLAWIAVLALLVAAEKSLPGGRWIARSSGIVFLAWGSVILVAG